MSPNSRLQMKNTTRLYSQLLKYLSQYSRYQDLRHLQALSWMVSALVCSQKLSLTAWESYVQSRAQQAQSYQRRWSRFLSNVRVKVAALYVPLVLAALSGWEAQRLYVALDTTVLWNRYCMIHLSVVWGGRAIPFLWQVIEHPSASVSYSEYAPLLRKARWLLRAYPDVMLLADRGFANHQLLEWLKRSGWHWCIRLPSDVRLHGPRQFPTAVAQLSPKPGEAMLYHNVGLWSDGTHRCNLVLAYPVGVDEPWAVITDESPTLQTLWQYALRFQIEELFLDSKSGAFQLEDSGLRDSQRLERLYLVAAVALLYSTVTGIAVQIEGLQRQVDPHWKRGLSYLKIGLRWLHGVVHKSRPLLNLRPLPTRDPQPCFASAKAQQDFYDQIWFSRIRSLRCNT